METLTENIIEIPGVEEHIEEIKLRTMAHAKMIADVMRIAFPPKRPFPKRDKLYRKRRKDRLTARAMAFIVPHMAAVDLATILTRPIPRFQDRIYPSGVVGEMSNEIIKIGNKIERQHTLIPLTKGSIVHPKGS